MQFEAQPGKFNGKTRQELLDCDVSCLNIYQKACRPRIKTRVSKKANAKLGLSREAFEAFLEM